MLKKSPSKYDEEARGKEMTAREVTQSRIIIGRKKLNADEEGTN